MLNLYTPIELSKLIHAAVPEVETEKWWRIEVDDGEEYPEIWDSEPDVRPGVRKCRIYRLDDVLRAVKVWDEKDVPPKPKHADNCDRTSGQCYRCDFIMGKCHKLVDAYLADGCQFGAESKRIIREIFTPTP